MSKPVIRCLFGLSIDVVRNGQPELDLWARYQCVSIHGGGPWAALPAMRFTVGAPAATAGTCRWIQVRRRPGFHVQLVIFLACLTVYLRTLHPTVSGGDSGELVFVAWKLGVAHAPGYPLYTMLAHAFTWLPSGSIAWRVNLLSAVCDAGAATLLFAIVRRFSRDTAAAAAAALLFAFSPLIWTYATQAEVFALNNLFVAMLLWLVLRWSEAPDDRHARLIAFAAGLGLSNHHTFVLVCVPVAAWMGIVSRGDVLRPRKLAVLAACSVAGLLPYLYLPLAARHATTLSWGDPSTVAGFFDVLLRRDYGTFG